MLYDFYLRDLELRIQLRLADVLYIMLVCKTSLTHGEAVRLVGTDGGDTSGELTSYKKNIP